MERSGRNSLEDAGVRQRSVRCLVGTWLGPGKRTRWYRVARVARAYSAAVAAARIARITAAERMRMSAPCSCESLGQQLERRRTAHRSRDGGWYRRPLIDEEATDWHQPHSPIVSAMSLAPNPYADHASCSKVLESSR